ncbi:MAG TPA: hypothetical protein VF595_17480 [Tepidisphaeraceae bacterium]|jgi:Ca2+-binding RTX toxin-like protein
MRSNISTFRSAIEALEGRQMFADINFAGTSGADTIYVTATPTVVTVTLNGVATNYTAVRAITINGGSGSDTIEVSNAITIGCTLAGNGGADTILGGSGNDLVTGGDGNDVLNGRAGSDTIYGNTGADTIYINNDNNTGDTAYANQPGVLTDGSYDLIYYSSNDNFYFDNQEDDVIGTLD